MTNDLGPTLSFLRERLPIPPRVALVLGTGLGGLADELTDAVSIPYADIPGFAAVTVKGHAGRLVAGDLRATPAAALQGRFHLYEGHAPADAVLPVRALAELGAHTLIVTAAAGALDPLFAPGDLMVIDDHINLLWANPLVGPVVEPEGRFPDMARPYDPALQALAARVARRQGTALRHGVYCAVRGPTYETRAETRMLRRMGGHAVGMSVVPEVLAARARGMRVLGIALVTNVAPGHGGPISHDDVVAMAVDAAGPLGDLVAGVVAELPAAGTS